MFGDQTLVPLVRQRLARLGGLPDLTAGQCARLTALAALHDIGKFNIGFQNKALVKPPNIAGHVREAVALLGAASRHEESRQLRAAIRLDQMLDWGREDSIARLLVAAIAHHGAPVDVGDSTAHQRNIWRPARGLDPFAGIQDLGESIRSWFPDAFAGELDPLPDEPRFQHGFSGLVTLADWLGSDTRFFPYADDVEANPIIMARAGARRALREVGIDPAAARNALSGKPLSFDLISPFEPRPPQRAAFELSVETAGSIAVLEAETGSGKTEAALARYLALFRAGAVDGMYFALPTRTAATQMHRRVFEAIKRAFPQERVRPPVVLAVPGYIAIDDAAAERLPGFEVLWPDKNSERFRFRGWAAENPKRYLAGSVVVGTVDQTLLSALMVNHAHMRSTALLRQLLIVDEVHASDTYMVTLLRSVLSNHLAAGGHALLMSATLGSHARGMLLSARPGASRASGGAVSFQAASEVVYPLLTHCAAGGDEERIAIERGGDMAKRVACRLKPWIDAPDAIAGAALAAASRGAKVLAVRNTVRDCLATQIALEQIAGERFLFACNGVPAPHHSRYAKEDRQALDHALEAQFGKDGASRGCVVVATQTVQLYKLILGLTVQ